MRTIIQRVSSASVTVDEKLVSSIGPGLLIFLGIEASDSAEDISWLVKKIVQLRIFADEKKQMNLSVADTRGELMIVSQFTLFASVKKGTRPSFSGAAKPELAFPLYEKFLEQCAIQLGKEIKS